jgi:Na+:H+ antiporter, NhaA family
VTDRRDPSDTEGLRLPWSRSDRPVPRRIVRPLQAFVSAETSSGIVLVAASAFALVWANGPLSDLYERTWATGATVAIGRWSIAGSVRSWIGEGLMTIFFLVVSLEIKRELTTGELRGAHRAALPAIAAIGGMVVPALIYLAFNPEGVEARAWGVAMPTDIAFALGVIGLAGRRVPSSVKILLLGIAIVDDLGSIVAVALFYSTTIDGRAVVLAAVLGVLVLVLQRIHVRAAAAYLLLGAGMWVALYGSGVSPTLAGVALGFLTPAVAFQRPRAVSEEAHRVADETVDDPYPPDADAAQWLSLAELSREAVSPLTRLETALHPWASFVVLPVFALANAGIPLTSEALAEAAGSSVAIGLIVARLLGKTAGITIAAYLGVRTGVAHLPAGLTWRHVLAVGAAAGIPFTVSLFIAELALPPATIDVVTLAVLVSAVSSGVIAYLLLRAAGSARTGPAEGHAVSL